MDGKKIRYTNLRDIDIKENGRYIVCIKKVTEKYIIMRIGKTTYKIKKPKREEWKNVKKCDQLLIRKEFYFSKNVNVKYARLHIEELWS